MVLENCTDNLSIETNSGVPAPVDQEDRLSSLSSDVASVPCLKDGKWRVDTAASLLKDFSEPSNLSIMGSYHDERTTKSEQSKIGYYIGPQGNRIGEIR